MSCHVFAGRFRSRQRRAVGKKSENGRCKLTKNRNTKPLIIRQDVKKGTSVGRMIKTKRKWRQNPVICCSGS